MPRLCWPALLGALGLACLLPEATAASHSFVRNDTPYAIDVWENDDGLPRNEVLSIIETSEGYLWLGTLSGLVRFDGIHFTVHDRLDTPGLRSSAIVHLFEDSHHDLWIGTQTAGTAVVREGRVLHLELGGDGRAGRLIASCEDLLGAVWLLGANGQLARIRPQSTNAGAGSPSAAKTEGDLWTLPGLLAGAPPTLVVETNGQLVLGLDDTLLFTNPAEVRAKQELPGRTQRLAGRIDLLLASRTGGHWRLANGRVEKWQDNQRLADFGEYPWGRTPVAAACEDAEGNLVVGTLGAGVHWFDAAGRSFHLSTDGGLSANFVLALYVDREGSLWIGTDGGGLNRVRQQVFSTLRPTIGQVVQTVAEDNDGGLWIGYNGGGVDHWITNTVVNYGSADGLPNGVSVRALLVDQSGLVRVGTWGAGLFVFENGRFKHAPGSGALHPVILALHQDPQGTLWVGTQGGLGRLGPSGWTLLTTRDGLPSDEVQALASDASGGLWIGTAGKGLARLSDGQVMSVHRDAGLAVDSIAAVHVDRHGTVWVGTYGEGLARFQDKTWTRYTTHDGLLSNTIGYFLEDDQDRLWMGTTSGLMRSPLTRTEDAWTGHSLAMPFRAYGKRDGMPSGECTLGSQPAACRSRDGRLWFATIKGLATANPARLKPNPHKPPVVIESVLIDGQPQGPSGVRAPRASTLYVPPGREHLEIHYTSLNLGAPDRALFRYRLEDHETSWTEAGTERVARYTKLPPAHYTFLVTACNEDGVWNDTPARLSIIIAPPFWRTLWFLVPATLTLLGLIIGTVHYLSTQKLHRQLELMRQHEAVEKERARIARDIHDQLGANLTQVALLGEMAEGDKDLPDEVESHARQIVQTARETTRALDEIVWTVNPSNDTLEGLANYACKYAQDYLALASLRYRFDIPPDLPAVEIAPEVRHNLFLAFKESVNNVVKHSRGTCGWVRLRIEPTRFTFEIADDGRGPAGIDTDAAKTRNGLRNMRRRMEDVGGSFEIGPAPEGGTQVRLTAPIRRS